MVVESTLLRLSSTIVGYLGVIYDQVVILICMTHQAKEVPRNGQAIMDRILVLTMDVGVEVNHPRTHQGQLEPIRPYQSQTSQRNKSVDRRDRSDRREREDHSREHRSYGHCGACGGQGHDAHFCRRRCKFCKQVHDVGRCELFTQFEQLTKFVKNTVDKALVPAELQHLYSSGHLN